MIKERQLLKPYRVRFTQEEDVKEYGEDWYVYDETALVRLPLDTLATYEEEMGRPLMAIMQGYRDNSVIGSTGAAWLAMKMSGKAPSWEMFKPTIMLAEWERVPASEQGKGSPPPTAGPTVALDTSPAAESGS